MTRHTLDQLEIGNTAVVRRLNAGGAIRDRLMDMGLLPGTPVLAEFRSPLGDPVAYRIRGALIALRRSQAREVEIDLSEGACQ
ncbi:MAG: ferrous iron transport protein A [Anaerolineae bacterium]|nr:ferrous iron transport protein A [Anaerolineae bacterium]NUQ03325.1 ferrous iron transport protein A [Anaerolineae bacterium]